MAASGSGAHEDDPLATGHLLWEGPGSFPLPAGCLLEETHGEGEGPAQDLGIWGLISPSGSWLSHNVSPSMLRASEFLFVENNPVSQNYKHS